MKVMLIEPPVSNLEAPGVIMPVTAAALRAAGHEVAQWNAGAEIIDGLLTGAAVRDAAACARETAARLGAEPGIDRLTASRLLTCMDSAPMADLLAAHIDAYKLSIRNGMPSGPLAGVAYNAVQAALEIHLAPFFPERVVFAARHRFQPQYVTTYSHRTAEDLAAAARARDLFWCGPFRDIAAPRVAEAAPNLVSLIVNETSQIICGMALAAAIREACPGVKIAFAGNWPGFAMDEIADPAIFDFIDFIVCDVPEAALPALCRHIDGEIAADAVPGIVFRDAGAVRATPLPPKSRALPFHAPDFSGYNFQHLLAGRRTLDLPFQITHGCEWGKCVFCAAGSPRIRGFCEPDMDEMIRGLGKVMTATGCASFRITDTSLPARAARAFSEALLKSNIIATWQAGVRPERGFDHAACELMRAAGCLGLDVGIESLCDAVLARMRKGVDLGEIEYALTNMALVNLGVNAHLIFGLPGVTRQEMDETMDTLLEFIKNGLVRNVQWNPFGLMKHSTMAKEPSRFGLEVVPADRADASEVLAFRRNTGMNDKELAALWPDVQNRTAQALARARGAVPQARPYQPTTSDTEFMQRRPMLLPFVRVSESHYAYQDLQNASRLQWNALDESYAAFTAAVKNQPGVNRLPNKRTLIKNPLTNTHFELSDDFLSVIEEIKTGGTVASVIERLAKKEANPNAPEIRETILKRMLAMRGYVIVFA